MGPGPFYQPHLWSTAGYVVGGSISKEGGGLQVYPVYFEHASCRLFGIAGPGEPHINDCKECIMVSWLCVCANQHLGLQFFVRLCPGSIRKVN